jgi:hypothetical protein
MEPTEERNLLRPSWPIKEETSKPREKSPEPEPKPEPPKEE